MMLANLTIDHLLHQYKNTIRKDYTRYKNHVYRVFMNCMLLDNNPENEEKYAIAAVYHDIGIWTDYTFDYLNPSIAKANQYLKEINKTAWIEEITLMIDMHHKMSTYRGKHFVTVETFRKADWIDVSLGLLTFGAPAKAIKTNQQQYKNLGFHLFLVKSTFQALWKHPFKNPLPMFKR